MGSGADSQHRSERGQTADPQLAPVPERRVMFGREVGRGLQQGPAVELDGVVEALGLFDCVGVTEP